MDEILDFVCFFLFDFFDFLFKKAFIEKTTFGINIFFIILYIFLSLFLLIGTVYLIYLLFIKSQFWFAFLFGILLLLFIFMIFAPIFQKIPPLGRGFTPCGRGETLL